MTNDADSQYSQVKNIFDVIHGEKEADLLIKNIQILDVYGESVYSGSLLIYDKRIVALNPDESAIQVRNVFDGQGLYAIPGLVDAHFHFESQLATPTALAEAIVPHGTTTVFAEILDLVSAAGTEGYEAARSLFKHSDQLPYRLYAFSPAKKVDVGITRKILDLPEVIGMGEYDHFSYRTGNEDDLKKAAYVRERNGFFNAHWGLTALDDMELNFLPAVGSTNNHDVWNGDDIAKSLRYGFNTQIKFGVGSPEVIRTLVDAIVTRKFPTEYLMLCSDNISMDRVRKLGHMEWIIAYCADRGLSPIKAIKMATLNPARYFKMEDQIGSLAPGRFADIILTDSLSRVDPLYVFKDGELVARDKKLLQKVEIDYSSMHKPAVKGLDTLSPEMLDVKPLALSEDGKMAKVLLFDVYGRGRAAFYQEIWLPIKDGVIEANYEGGPLARLSVIQRYGKDDGSRHILNGFFKGTYVREGAVGVSFPSPQAYLVVVGQESDEMCYCARELDKYSGAAVVTKDGHVQEVLPIELYGMMANLSLAELMARSSAIDEALEEMGNNNIGEPVVNKLLSLFISLHRFRLMEE